MNREQRRLAAILVADVVGYSRLVGQDEAGTLARLAALRREVIQPTIARHAGRLFKAMGDGFLVEFASAVQAVTAARAIQEANAAGGLLLRIGIHVGDVVVEGDDLMGDGVNIAARIEGIADPGGIVISRQVHDQVRDKLDVSFVDKGEVALKNLARPVQVFVLRGVVSPSSVEPPPALPLPDKPSIAVLPFQNMSGDPEQEYFADGIAEDIVTALSHFPSLFVVARNSSFNYKGRAIDINQVGRELGVRYVLEGSVRKAGGRIRINGQLIQADTNTHIWAERYDGDLSDIFAVQDRITEAVAGAIAPSIEQAEIDRAQRKPPASLDAHDLYLRALALFYAMSRQGSDEARVLLEQTMMLDPTYAAPVSLLARLLVWRVAQGWSSVAEIGDEVKRYALLAEQMDRHNADGLAYQARFMTYLEGLHGEGITRAERALALNPNSATAWSLAGWVYVYAGQPDTAVNYLKRAMRLNPRDPMDFDTWVALSLAFIQLERDAEAVDAARQAAQRGSNYSAAWRALAASLALTGKLEEARSAIATLLLVDPGLTLARMRSWRAWTEAARARFFEGLRLAGLPE